MRLVKGTISASVKQVLEEIDLDDHPTSSKSILDRTYILQKLMINNEPAWLQRHNIPLEEGDEVTASGFSLFGKFMIMAIQNESRNAFFRNRKCRA